MSSLEEIRQARLQKREEFLSSGEPPYPIDGGPYTTLREVLGKFAQLRQPKKTLRVAGRILAFREHGKSFFADIYDGTARMQVFAKIDEVGDESFERFLAKGDIGDIVEITGEVFLTKKKEKSIFMKRWAMLAKSVRPLPEKWHGLTDTEERFRKRYLDLLMNEEVRERFLLRSHVVASLRRFLLREGFIEVETPLLHPIPGGALARPFVTRHDALNHDFYLRVAPELYLKRLLIGGMPRIFEIGRNFRNEGIDATHNPEFSMLELYEAFQNAEGHMAFLTKLFRALVKDITKGNSLVYGSHTIAYTVPFARISFPEALKRFALLSDYEGMSKNEMGLRAQQMGIDSAKGKEKGKIADEIFKKVCRPKIIQPTFVIDIPQDISPLAKSHPDKKHIADRYMLIMGGLEVANGFSELNDPVVQRERFEAQEQALVAGDTEVTRLDEEFLEALEYGMPPAAGIGIGIDRLAMLCMNVPNIREAILFPTLRPKKK